MAQGSVNDRGYTQSQQVMLDDAKRTHAATTATAQRALQARASPMATHGLEASAPPPSPTRDLKTRDTNFACCDLRGSCDVPAIQFGTHRRRTGSHKHDGVIDTAMSAACPVLRHPNKRCCTLL